MTFPNHLSDSGSSIDKSSDRPRRGLSLFTRMFFRWRPLIVRSLIATIVAWVLATAPLPAMTAQTWIAYVQVPIVIFLLICYLGKLLIDTFFYDHYHP